MGKTRTGATVPVCAKCKSFDVRFDAYAGFNPEKQRYEHISEHDNPVCEACSGECSTEWIPFGGETKKRWKAWREGGPSKPPTVWRLEVTINATMYVKAGTAEDAVRMAREQDETSIELSDWHLAYGVPFSSEGYNSPALPDISLSPAMTLVVAEDITAEDAEE